jgi:MoaA/NifB/PqqE/SkfB family radical SAM enzyme
MPTGVSKELALRRDHLCAVPFTGMTINPRGQVTLCCMTPRYVVGNLGEIPDLTEFYNGAIMEFFRTEMEEGRIGSLVPCSNFCWKNYSAGQHSFMTIANQSPHMAKAFDADWQLRKASKPRPIRFLEYTCSNICNQTCSTCSSFFSSKWRDIERQFSSQEMKRFDRHITDVQSLSEGDIAKIMKILPDLSQLVVKGGEPWADKNNMRVLDELLDVNPQCAVVIVSNMQSISESTFKMLEKIKTNRVENFTLTASIDGIGKVYEWIRSSPFEKTIRNLERFYETTGRKIDISACTSILNYFHLEAIVDYFVDKEYITGVAFNNVAVSPKYIGAHNLPDAIYGGHRAVLERRLPLYREKLGRRGKWFAFNPVLQDIQLNRPFSVSELRLSMQWIEKMNEIRGFRL